MFGELHFFTVIYTWTRDRLERRPPHKQSIVMYHVGETATTVIFSTCNWQHRHTGLHTKKLYEKHKSPCSHQFLAHMYTYTPCTQLTACKNKKCQRDTIISD